MKVSTTISITTRILSGKFRPLLRHMSAARATSNAAVPVVRRESLFQSFFKLGSNNGKVADIIRGCIKSGKIVTKSTLVHNILDLRKFGRYHICLEIFNWLEKSKHEFTDWDYALRLDTLYKVKGLGEVEKYFNSVPSNMKARYTYAALLNCYCTQPATDKALATFATMEKKGFVPDILTFNSMLNLFVKVGQPENVPVLVADMKHKNVTLNTLTYCFWMQSYRLLGDLEGVERVFREAEEQELVKYDWRIYSDVASTYIEFGQTEKAVAQLEKLEHVLDNSDRPNRIAYKRLMIFYADAGKLDSVLQAWSKLKSKITDIQTEYYYYLGMLQALSKLNDIAGLEKYFQEWQSTNKSYDHRLPSTLIKAYLKHDMLQKAEFFLEDCTNKTGKVLMKPHLIFMDYYIEKGNTNGALKHMEVALNSNWKPLVQNLDPCFRHFKARKDVDGVEKFCRLLKRAGPLDAEAYSWLLQTYVEAEKTSPDMRRRMEEDGVDISPKLEELLERVCRDS